MRKLISDWTPSWPVLRALGNSRAAKSTAIWLVIIPLTAKMTEHIDSLSFFIQGNTYTFNLSLPFNWKLLFLSALLIGLATLLYQLWCPNANKLYSNYSDFKRLGKTKTNITGLFQITIKKEHNYSHICQKRDALIGFLDQYVKPIPIATPLSDSELFHILDTNDIIQGKDAEAFWYVWHFSEKQKPTRRMLVYILYGLGFLAFAFIILSNAFYVWYA